MLRRTRVVCSLVERRVTFTRKAQHYPGDVGATALHNSDRSRRRAPKTMIMFILPCVIFDTSTHLHRYSYVGQTWQLGDVRAGRIT
jgi:hypothetical protein